MGRVLTIGDIHGAHKALEQCLERCGFDYENDTLITLGDICDGWPYVYECVEILLKVKTIDIIGNHDEWFRVWLESMRHPDKWSQGGKGTALSYLRRAGKDPDEFSQWYEYDQHGRPYSAYEFPLDTFDVPPEHQAFFRGQHLYYKDDKNRLFVHAGLYDKDLTLKQNKRHRPTEFYWNRNLWHQAMSVHDGEHLKFAEEFSEIFIGHTQTTNWTKFKKAPNSLVLIPTQNDDCPPMKADIIYNLDTGAGSNGKLTIMDVDTHDYWQSDCVNEIYGEYKPR